MAKFKYLNFDCTISKLEDGVYHLDLYDNNRWEYFDEEFEAESMKDAIKLTKEELRKLRY